MESESQCLTPTRVAEKRWKLLALAIKRKKSTMDLDEPKSKAARKFPSYDLIQSKEMPMKQGKGWFNLTLELHPGIELKICTVPQVFSSQELMGFNNTGNVCIWPSEECLATYCLENPDLLAGKRILELGGGMSALAGLLVAAGCRPAETIVSDGNPTSVENIEEILEANPSLHVSSRLLRWDDETTYGDLVGQIDVVICGDCLFFDEGRVHLRDCIEKVLGPNGQALVMAPKRGGTFDKFISISKKVFETEVLDNYSNRISSIRKHLMMDNRFQEDIHYPHLIKLMKMNYS